MLKIDKSLINELNLFKINMDNIFLKDMPPFYSGGKFQFISKKCILELEQKSTLEIICYVDYRLMLWCSDFFAYENIILDEDIKGYYITGQALNLKDFGIHSCTLRTK
jgi:hypothetical protein